MKHIILFITILLTAAGTCLARPAESATGTDADQKSDSIARAREIWEIDEWLDTTYVDPVAEGMAPVSLPRIMFMPAVYNTYIAPDTTYFLTPDYSGVEGMEWIETEMANDRKIKAIQYDLFYKNPEIVRYNVALLPKPPNASRPSSTPPSTK